MRVAVKHPARTEPNGDEVPESIAAYRFGRIEDFVNPLTDEVTEKAEVARQLVEKAKAEFPECEVFIQRLVHNEGSESEEHVKGTSTWVHEDEVPEGARSPGGGLVAEHVVSTEQPVGADQEATS